MDTYWINWPKSEYSKEISQVANKVIEYLKKCAILKRQNMANGKQSKEDAVIFDIDDTLLFRDSAGVCGLSMSYEAFVNKVPTIIELSPPNAPIVRIANESKKYGQKVIIITSRVPDTGEETINNLKIFNIPYDEIYFNPCRTSPDGDYGQFKASSRKELERKYNIICTIGDQLTDIYISDYKTAMIKLPELSSKCSYMYFPDI